MKTFLILGLFMVVSVSFGQKSKLNNSGKRIHLKSLGVPAGTGDDALPAEIEREKKKSRARVPASISVKKASGTRLNISAQAACVLPNGLTIAHTDPSYGDCINQRSFAKKIILQDPTQSIMMRINLHDLGF